MPNKSVAEIGRPAPRGATKLSSLTFQRPDGPPIDMNRVSFSNPVYQGSYGHESQGARTFRDAGRGFLETDYSKDASIGSRQHFCIESRSFAGSEFCIVDFVTVGSL